MRKPDYLKKTFMALILALAPAAMQAADQYTLGHWSFNYTYTVVDGVGTPSSTAQTGNGSENLHGVKLVPNEQIVDGIYLTAHRPTLATEENQVEAQDNKGAYLEVNAISCDGAALHMTSPVPTPESASTSYTYGSNTATFPDGNSYSYQNPYNYFELELSTVDYKNIQMEVKAAGHRSTSQYFAVAYSTDKSSWTVVSDEYLTGSSYNNWTTNTISLDAIGGQEKVYVRLFPADNWKGANDNINSDNQFDLDYVKVTGELDADLAQITAIAVNGEAATAVEDKSYNYDYLLDGNTYTASTVTVAPTFENATLKVYVEDEEGDTQTCTDNGDGTYTFATPAAETYCLVTFKVTPVGEAVAQQETYVLRVFNLTEIKLAGLAVDGVSVGSTLLNEINDKKTASKTDYIYTKMPVVTCSVIDGSDATVTGSLSGTTATYVIKAGDSEFTLNVEGVHVYTIGENDEVVEITYSADGKAAYTATDEWTDGWTDGMYTLRTTKLDGWGGSQFKFNGTEFKFEIPGGVVVKSFAFAKFGANYGNGEGVTSFTSDGATCWVPTDHDYVRGAKDTVTVVLDNHQAGTPLEFTITGGSQPYAQFYIIIEKTNPGTAPEVTTSKATVINNHAMISVSFDREMTLTTVEFNGQSVTASGGTTLTFGVTDLSYNTDYTFTIPAGTATDLFGNVNAEDITVTFTVGEKQAVTKKTYDYVVGTADELTAALKEIGSSTDTSLDRVIIFMKKGDYDFGENNEQRINRGNVSLIGQWRDSVLIHGTRTGISNPILNIRDREGFYLQDFTARNDLDFGTTRKGVGVAIYGGNKSIFKNICMQSQQDTQVTGERSYYDACRIQGTVDFICGGGNHFYDKCDIILEGSGAVISAPATVKTAKFGYVFSHCTISANENTSIADGGYTLARPWQNEPRTYYLYTTMNVKPTDNGYANMSNLPTHFYEYGSVDKDGNTIDLSVRGNSSSSTNSYTPVITDDEAKTFTVINVLAETDGWLPTDYTVLRDAPSATVKDGVISWEDDDQALCYVIFKDDEYVTNITENSYAPEETGTYQIRTANEMGGLSAVATEVNVTVTGISQITADETSSAKGLYNLAGQKVNNGYKGIVIQNGRKVVKR